MSGEWVAKVFLITVLYLRKEIGIITRRSTCNTLRKILENLEPEKQNLENLTLKLNFHGAVTMSVEDISTSRFHV